METPAQKIESLSSAVMVGKSIQTQLRQDRAAYEEAFAEQQKSIVDERIKALHKICFNSNVNAYTNVDKELEDQITDYQEQINDITNQNKQSNETAQATSEDTDSQAEQEG